MCLSGARNLNPGAIFADRRLTGAERRILTDQRRNGCRYRERDRGRRRQDLVPIRPPTQMISMRPSVVDRTDRIDGLAGGMVDVQGHALPQLASCTSSVRPSLVASLRRNYMKSSSKTGGAERGRSVQTKRISKSPDGYRSWCDRVTVDAGIAAGDSRRTECVSA
jgi:hypothetical protein